MPEYIEREALIKEIEADFNTDWADYASKNNFDKDYIDGVRDEYDDTLKIICQQKTADVQPVRHGRWESPVSVGNGIKFCSVCRNEAYWDTDYGQQLFDYCPYCGAQMDKENSYDRRLRLHLTDTAGCK